MENEFVTYPLALRMKALGYNEPCFAYFKSTGVLSTKSDEYELYLINNDKWILPACSAPTWQAAFAWFRKEHNLFSFIHTSIATFETKGFEYGFTIFNIVTQKYESFGYVSRKSSPEEAQQACLEKLCEIVEKQKEDGRKEN